MFLVLGNSLRIHLLRVVVQVITLIRLFPQEAWLDRVVVLNLTEGVARRLRNKHFVQRTPQCSTRM
jgi:hypothetical protein